MATYMTHTKDSPANLRGRSQCIEVFCNPELAVSVCITKILDVVREMNQRDVLVHLVGALFRVCGHKIHAKEPQKRQMHGNGDFQFDRVAYYVTVVPTILQFKECMRDIAAQRLPVLLVPELALPLAHQLARRKRITRKLTIFSLEEFFVRALLFEAVNKKCSVVAVLKTVVKEYNRVLKPRLLPSIRITLSDAACHYRPIIAMASHQARG